MSPYDLVPKLTPAETEARTGKLGRFPHLYRTLMAIKQLGAYGASPPPNKTIAQMIYAIPQNGDGDGELFTDKKALNRLNAILYGEEKGSVLPQEADFLYGGFQRAFGPAARVSRDVFLKTPVNRLTGLMKLETDESFWSVLDPAQALDALAAMDGAGMTLALSFDGLRWEIEDGETLALEADERPTLRFGEEHYLKLDEAPRRSDPPLALIVGERPGRLNGAELRAQTLRAANPVSGGWRIGRSALTPLNAPKIAGNFSYVVIAGAVRPLRTAFELPEGEARRLDSARLGLFAERLRQEQVAGRIAVAALPFRVSE